MGESLVFGMPSARSTATRLFYVLPTDVHRRVRGTLLL